MQLNNIGKMDNAGTLSGTMASLREKGYTEDLMIREGKLIGYDGKLQMDARDVTVDRVYRFEGMSDPGDNSILYAISAPKNNVKGLLAHAYGTYAEEVNAKVLKELERSKGANGPT